MMAYCLDPITAWPPLCPQRTPINKSNPVFWQGLWLSSLPNTGITGRPRQRGGRGGGWGGCESKDACTFRQWRQNIIYSESCRKITNFTAKKKGSSDQQVCPLSKQRLHIFCCNFMTCIQINLALSDVTKGTDSPRRVPTPTCKAASLQMP